MTIVEELAEAGVELAEYASYSEIVGGISHNRSAIRKWCDKVFALKRELDSLCEPESLDGNASCTN